MGPRRAFSSACVLIMGLLGATRLSSGAKCRCSDIRNVELAVPKDGCLDTKETHRYDCNPGYVRQAGTSSFIRCEKKDGIFQWTVPTLKCIPDPKKTTSRSGTSTNLQNVWTSTSEATKSSNTEPTTLGTSTSLPSVRTSTSEAAKSIDTGTSTNLQNVWTSTSEATKSSNTEPTTLGTSTNLQNVRTSTSEAAKSSNTEPTTLGTSTSLPSVRTSTSEAAKSIDTGTSTNLQNVRTSTSEAAKSSNTKPTTLGEGKRMKSGGDDKAVSISLSVVILLFAICCIIIYLYRRRKGKIPPREAEELEPMNEMQISHSFSKEPHGVNRQRDV